MNGTRKYCPECGYLITKEHTCYAIADKLIGALNTRILKIQFTDQMKLNKKKHQNVDTLALLRRGNYISTGGDTETMCGAESKGKTFQKLPHMGNQPIQSPIPGIIVDTNKCMLKGACLLLTPERLCQYLTNTEVDTLSQPLD